MSNPPKQLPNTNQLKFLNAREVGRLAVADKEGMPHVTPIIYAMDGVYPVIATDYGTKKAEDPEAERQAGLVVDDVNPNKGVMIQGTVEIFERGKEYIKLLKVRFDRWSTTGRILGERANPRCSGSLPSTSHPGESNRTYVTETD